MASHVLPLPSLLAVSFNRSCPALLGSRFRSGGHRLHAERDEAGVAGRSTAALQLQATAGPGSK